MNGGFNPPPTPNDSAILVAADSHEADPSEERRVFKVSCPVRSVPANVPGKIHVEIFLLGVKLGVSLVKDCHSPSDPSSLSLYKEIMKSFISIKRTIYIFDH